MNTTIAVKTNAQLRELNLSFYSLCKLADRMRCVNPMLCLEQRIETHGFVGFLTLDPLGNYVDFA